MRLGTAALHAYGQLARHVGASLVERDAAVVRHRERAAAVGSAVRGAAEVLRQHLDVAVEGGERDLGVALVVVLEVEAAAVGGPHRAGDAAVEVAGDDARAAPVEVHDLQPAHLIGARAVLVAHERDAPPVGRDGRALIGAGAAGERADLPARHRCDVQLGVAVVEHPVRVAVGGEDEMPAVRRPGGRARVLEISGGHRDRGSALRGDDEEVVVAEVQVADAVLPVLEAVLHDGRGGPVCSGRWTGRGRQARRRIGHQHVEGDVAAVRRPADPAGRFGELRERCRLAGVHPAQMDLPAGRVGEPGAVRRPARRSPRPQAPVIRAVRVHDPEFRALPVAHDVHRGAHVDDLAAVRGDLRVGGVFEREDIHRLEVRLGAGGAGNRQGDQQGGGEAG